MYKTGPRTTEYVHKKRLIEGIYKQLNEAASFAREHYKNGATEKQCYLLACLIYEKEKNVEDFININLDGEVCLTFAACSHHISALKQ
jgi:hypothetical protein